MLSACKYGSPPSINLLPESFMDCHIRKIPVVVTKAYYREIDSEKVTRKQKMTSLAADSLDVISQGLTGSKSGAALDLIVMTLKMLNIQNGIFKAQELTVRPTGGGRERIFLQLVYKETGFIKPGTRGELVEYGSSEYVRFMPSGSNAGYNGKGGGRRGARNARYQDDDEEYYDEPSPRTPYRETPRRHQAASNDAPRFAPEKPQAAESAHGRHHHHAEHVHDKPHRAESGRRDSSGYSAARWAEESNTTSTKKQRVEALAPKHSAGGSYGGSSYAPQSSSQGTERVKKVRVRVQNP